MPNLTLAPLVVLGIALPARAEPPHYDFDVTFRDCTEFVGIGLVPYAQARDLVPTAFDLAGDGVDAIVVVRVSDCDEVAFEHGHAKPGTLTQIGITIVGPDAAADIDNYTLWYGTDNRKLQRELDQAGVDAVLLDDIDYSFADDGTGTGPLDIAVEATCDLPDHAIAGTATAPTSAPTLFVARWHREGPHGDVVMETTFPDIQFSSAVTTLTTSAGSDLADLIGAASLTFPILDSYNAFTEAPMAVTVD